MVFSEIRDRQLFDSDCDEIENSQVFQEHEKIENEYQISVLIEIVL